MATISGALRSTGTSSTDVCVLYHSIFIRFYSVQCITLCSGPMHYIMFRLVYIEHFLYMNYLDVPFLLMQGKQMLPILLFQILMRELLSFHMSSLQKLLIVSVYQRKLVLEGSPLFTMLRSIRRLGGIFLHELMKKWTVYAVEAWLLDVCSVWLSKRWILVHRRSLLLNCRCLLVFIIQIL